MLSICTELFSDRRQGGVVDCAASEWIPIISHVPQGRVLGSLLCMLYTSEMFDMVKNRLFAYAVDYTLLAVVRKPAYRPAVIAFLKRDFFRIQEWYNQCCMVLNPNKSEALVISRSRTVTPPQGDLILSGASIRASPNLDILGPRHCFHSLSENWYFEVGDAYISGHLCVTSLLFCICSPNP